MTTLSATEVRVLSLLLERVLALPADEREAFIAALPERQQVLVPRLRERLASLVQVEPGAAAVAPPPPRPAPRAEVRVGPYRLLDPLGGDGAGRVWRAERGEGAARKEFALRLPASPDAAAPAAPGPRAEEMQVVLLPAHADIVRLVDAGVDAEGRFYRVLPLIDGLGLVEHAQRRGHGERAVAQLMLKAAQLVALAHAEQVACGALRTSSFRVDDDSRVLLLDWGQGRALRPDTIAADVMALGRVLQLLLAGTDPGAGRAAEAGGARRVRPVTPGPDLARVLQRALHAPGAQPYAGVQAMVDDLRLILDFRPVPGAPGGALHLARLFLRRNRLALVAGVLAGALLLALANVGWRAYSQGQAQARRGDQVQVFLAEHLPGPVPGADGQPPDIGVEAPRLQRALETARFGFPGDPVLRGQVITALGLRFRALGQPEQAQAVLQEAVTLLKGTARAGDPALHNARVALAQQLLQLGEAGAAAQAAALARQVLDGCTAGDACAAARDAARAVLQQGGAGR